MGDTKPKVYWDEGAQSPLARKIAEAINPVSDEYTIAHRAKIVDIELTPVAQTLEILWDRAMELGDEAEARIIRKALDMVKVKMSAAEQESRVANERYFEGGA